MASEMPTATGEFGDRPAFEFPSETAPAGLKVVELFEGNGPMVRRGDTVTVNYHGVVWGKDTPFDSSFDRHQPASFGIGVGQVIKGWDQTVPVYGCLIDTWIMSEYCNGFLLAVVCL